MRFKVAVSPLPKGGAPSTAGGPGKTWLGGPAVQPVTTGDIRSGWVPKLCPVQNTGKSAFRAAEGLSVLLFTALRFPAPSRHRPRASFPARCLTASSVAFSFPRLASTWRPYFFLLVFFFLHLLFPPKFLLEGLPTLTCPRCSCALPFLLPQAPPDVPDELPWLQPRSCPPPPIARLPPWEPHAHCCLCT